MPCIPSGVRSSLLCCHNGAVTVFTQVPRVCMVRFLSNVLVTAPKQTYVRTTPNVRSNSHVRTVQMLTAIVKTVLPVYIDNNMLSTYCTPYLVWSVSTVAIYSTTSGSSERVSCSAQDHLCPDLTARPRPRLIQNIGFVRDATVL